ncbi:hypothetical protein ABTN44_13195, partial [Acinetobacter baumannii]
SHRQLIILNTPISKEVGVFFYMGNQSIENYFKYRTTNYFWMLTRFYGYNEEVFYFWCPREN